MALMLVIVPLEGWRVFRNYDVVYGCEMLLYYVISANVTLFAPFDCARATFLIK
jgi:hypothetical protein